MNSVERVKALCKERRIPISKLEKDLGYANGYIGQLRKGTFPADRLKEISEYLDVSIEYLMTGRQPSVDYVVRGTNEETGEEYYLNIETAKMAQDIFENKELRVLFDAARDASPDDLQTVHSMLLALKRKEQGNID